MPRPKRAPARSAPVSAAASSAVVAVLPSKLRHSAALYRRTIRRAIDPARTKKLALADFLPSRRLTARLRKRK